MASGGPAPSRLATILVAVRVVAIVAGIVCIGVWGVGSLGGNIQLGYFVAGIALFVGAYAVSFLG